VDSAESGELEAAVSIHGARHTLDYIKNSEAPLLFIVPEGDTHFPGELVEEIKELFERGEADGGIQVVKGVTHGFAVRGDYTIEDVKQKADKALDDTAAFLLKYLKT